MRAAREEIWQKWPPARGDNVSISLIRPIAVTSPLRDAHMYTQMAVLQRRLVIIHRER